MSHRVSRLARVAVVFALAGAAGAAQAVTEIQWWHAMTGANNDRVNALAKKFSDSQKEYKVTAVQVTKVTQPSAWQQRHRQPQLARRPQGRHRRPRRRHAVGGRRRDQDRQRLQW